MPNNNDTGHGGFKAKPMPDYPSMVHDGVAPVNHRPQTIPKPFKGQMYLDNPKPPLAEQNDDSSVVRGFKARPYPVQIFNTVPRSGAAAATESTLAFSNWSEPMDSVVSALTSFTSGTPCVAIVNIMLDNEDFIFMIKEVCRVLIRVSRNGNLVSMLDKIMSPVVDYCHSDLPLERVAGYALVLDLQGNVLHGKLGKKLFSRNPDFKEAVLAKISAVLTELDIRSKMQVESQGAQIQSQGAQIEELRKTVLEMAEARMKGV